MNQIYLGCYEGHLFVLDLYTMKLTDRYLKLNTGIYDMVLMPD